MLAARSRPLAERFWERVDKRGPVPAHAPHLGPCWLWTAGRQGDGYGQIGTGSKGVQNRLAHRVSWELHYGPVPDGLEVCHRCDVKRCVNPAHLFVGTHADNMGDMSAKGYHPFRLDPTRAAHGEATGHTKLTADTVRIIRARYAVGDVSQAALGREYGVEQTAIGAVVRRRNWKHV